MDLEMEDGRDYLLETVEKRLRYEKEDLLPRDSGLMISLRAWGKE